VPWGRACAFRLARHGLGPTAPAGATPEDVAAAVCGVHAQVATAAEWSVGLRLPGSRQQDVRAALWEQRTLVRTFGPRGTVHLLPARDLAAWTAALSAIPALGSGLPPAAGLTGEQAGEVVAAVADALDGPGRDGTSLTVAELSTEVIARTGPWAAELTVPGFGGMWPRWRQALPLAGWRGALCQGPARGRRVTYTSPARWLAGFQPPGPLGRPGPAGAEEAGWLVLEYLRAYGPATPSQFAQWLGAPRSWAAELFTSLGGQLREVSLDGTPAWLRAGDPGPHRGGEIDGGPRLGDDHVRLLPYFDAYLVGGHPRSLLYPGRAAGRALSRTGQAGTFPVLLIGGTVRGVWHQRRSGRDVVVTVEPLGRLTAAQRRGLAYQADRLGEFYGLRPQLEIGQVTAGSHA
jgi:hypothetical protein